MSCCWGYEGCDCGDSGQCGDCHDCHCMRSSCPECGEIMQIIDRAEARTASGKAVDLVRVEFPDDGHWMSLSVDGVTIRQSVLDDWLARVGKKLTARARLHGVLSQDD